MSLFWGMIIAELAWIFNFLVIGYKINFQPYFNFIIPQSAIILTVLSFISFNQLIKNKTENDKKVEQNQKKDFLPEIIFATILILTLLLFFSSIPVAKS